MALEPASRTGTMITSNGVDVVVEAVKPPVVYAVPLVLPPVVQMLSPPWPMYGFLVNSTWVSANATFWPSPPVWLLELTVLGKLLLVWAVAKVVVKARAGVPEPWNGAISEPIGNEESTVERHQPPAPVVFVHM